jgi:recombinational DNA repair ATPase RecF
MKIIRLQSENVKKIKAVEIKPDGNVVVVSGKNGAGKTSLLDSGNMAVIQQMAKDQDYQVWIEQVDESGKVGIYIEDGQVRETE